MSVSLAYKYVGFSAKRPSSLGYSSYVKRFIYDSDDRDSCDANYYGSDYHRVRQACTRRSDGHIRFDYYILERLWSEFI